MCKEDTRADRKSDNSTPEPNRPPDFHSNSKEKDQKLWKVILFGSIAATATTVAVTRMRGTVDWVYDQVTVIIERFYWRFFMGKFPRGSTKRHNRRVQEMMEEEMERVERIRRMQSVFNRSRNKYKRNSESWSESDSGAYHQQSQRDDWYWKADPSSRNQGAYFREAPRASANSVLSHHYSILGLDRLRIEPYTDDEIKSAFRAKAKEFHPDQNQENKEAAEAKFKEIMVSYQAIKSERKNPKSTK